MKFIVRTDEHVSNKPPKSRTDDYLATCKDKLRQIAEIARREDADAVIDNGDFFHRTGVSGNPFSMIKEMIDLHREEYPCPIYENPGNHDFPYGKPDHISNHPLGLMFSSGAFQRMENVQYEENGHQVRLVGVPFDPDLTEADLDIDKRDEDTLIVASHASAKEEGGLIFGGEERALSYHELASYPPDVFIFGHWHIDQGVKWIDETCFINLGAMTRGALTKDNLDRIPRVGILEVSDEGIEVQTEQLDVRPAEEVFDVEDHKRRKENEKSIDRFVASLKEESKNNEDGPEEQIESMSNFPEEVKEKALMYLRQVD